MGDALMGHFRETWSNADDAEMTRLVGLGYTDRQIGDTLGRTPKAVSSRRCELRLVKRQSHHDWTPAEVATLRLAAVVKGVRWEEVAVIVGRTPYACKKKYAESFSRRPSRTPPPWQRNLPWEARIKRACPDLDPVAYSNALYLGEVRLAFGCTDFGALKDYYTSRCELDVPPGYDGYRLTSIYRDDSRSYVGSTAAMCESA